MVSHQKNLAALNTSGHETKSYSSSGVLVLQATPSKANEEEGVSSLIINTSISNQGASTTEVFQWLLVSFPVFPKICLQLFQTDYQTVCLSVCLFLTTCNCSSGLSLFLCARIDRCTQYQLAWYERLPHDCQRCPVSVWLHSYFCEKYYVLHTRRFCMYLVICMREVSLINTIQLTEIRAIYVNCDLYVQSLLLMA